MLPQMSQRKGLLASGGDSSSQEVRQEVAGKSSSRVVVTQAHINAGE